MEVRHFRSREREFFKVTKHAWYTKQFYWTRKFFSPTYIGKINHISATSSVVDFVFQLTSHFFVFIMRMLKSLKNWIALLDIIFGIYICTNYTYSVISSQDIQSFLSTFRSKTRMHCASIHVHHSHWLHLVVCGPKNDKRLTDLNFANNIAVALVAEEDRLCQEIPQI